MTLALNEDFLCGDVSKFYRIRIKGYNIWKREAIGTVDQQREAGETVDHLYTNTSSHSEKKRQNGERFETQAEYSGVTGTTVATQAIRRRRRQKCLALLTFPDLYFFSSHKCFRICVKTNIFKVGLLSLPARRALATLVVQLFSCLYAEHCFTREGAHWQLQLLKYLVAWIQKHCFTRQRAHWQL